MLSFLCLRLLFLPLCPPLEELSEELSGDDDEVDETEESEDEEDDEDGSESFEEMEFVESIDTILSLSIQETVLSCFFFSFLSLEKVTDLIEVQLPKGSVVGKSDGGNKELEDGIKGVGFGDPLTTSLQDKSFLMSSFLINPFFSSTGGVLKVGKELGTTSTFTSTISLSINS